MNRASMEDLRAILPALDMYVHGKITASRTLEIVNEWLDGERTFDLPLPIARLIVAAVQRHGRTGATTTEIMADVGSESRRTMQELSRLTKRGELERVNPNEKPARYRARRVG